MQNLVEVNIKNVPKSIREEVKYLAKKFDMTRDNFIAYLLEIKIEERKSLHYLYQRQQKGSIKHYQETLFKIPKEEAPCELEKNLYRLCESADTQSFQDGVRSDFIKKLFLIIKEHKNLAISVINRLISNKIIQGGVIAEILRWLGHIKDSKTHKYRQYVLIKNLQHSAPEVRDGAVLGLVYMGDSEVIPSLKRAIKNEVVDELRQDMQSALKELSKIQDG